jgi:hypothetical protein
MFHELLTYKIMFERPKGRYFVSYVLLYLVLLLFSTLI